MKVLSVVCARAGSKGLKNKCIAKIKGKMVIEYSIEYSLSLGENVKTVVSTDIGRVIDYCRTNGIAYIKRCPELCSDESRIDDALADAIEKTGEGCDLCSLVYGNIPTRYPMIFQEALRYLGEDKDCDAVISMQNVGKFHPAWMFDYNDTILPRQKEVHYRRQELPQKMIHDGHTLVFRNKGFYKRFKALEPYDKEYIYSVYGTRIKPLVTDEVIIDIDTGIDLKLADAFIERRSKKERGSRSGHII